MNVEKGQVLIEVCESQSGGYSLTISDNDSGYRLAGGKVGGMDTIHSFVVDAAELAKLAKEYGKIE